MRFGVGDLLLAGFNIPHAPRGDDLHIGGKRLDRQLKPHLIVALAGAAVTDGVCALLLGDLHQALGDNGPAKEVPSRYLLSYTPFALRVGQIYSSTNSFFKSAIYSLEAPVFFAFSSRPSSSPAPCPTSAETAITSQLS